MSETVLFYVLSRKFLQREEDVPASSAAQQVLYQALALGHHIGVIDCLKPVLDCPLDGYVNWIARLPAGEARRKLEGVARWGEIMIDSTHVNMLALALDRSRADFAAEELPWSDKLMQVLQSIAAEPAMYLMVKRRAG
jgi:hypothetical protein